MTPLIFGALVGLLSACFLTFAYYRMHGIPALLALLGTIFVSMLPRIYFSVGAYQGSGADFDYVGGWMLVVAVGFYVSYAHLKHFFKRRR